MKYDQQEVSSKGEVVTKGISINSSTNEGEDGDSDVE